MELLVIGLDGLSYNMLERFDVEFPYLEKLQSEGLSGDLMSVDTPTTIPAWTSFATGKDPGSHGVHSMKHVSRTYEHGPAKVNTTDAAIYDFLDDCVFINLPASAGRKPAATNTYVQSSLLAADKAEMVPEPLTDLDAYADYVPVHDPTLKTRPNKYLEHVVKIARSRERFAREAFETHDPRVGFVLFSTTDWAGHILSKLTADDHRERFYRTIVGEVADATANLAGLCDNVLLLSDHGFEYKHTTVHLADWLHEVGYMETVTHADQRSASDRVLDAAASATVGAAKALSRRSDRFYDLVRFMHNRLLGTDIGARLQSAVRPDVDYAQSTVWQLRYGCLYLNDNRFQNPQISGDAASELQDELIERLQNLENDDGDPIFRAVLRPKEAYTDPLPSVPDVIPRPAPGHFPITHWSPTGGYTSPTSNYEHRYRGLIAAEGPAFETGSVEDMQLIDVLPTVFALLGESLAPDFDGEARTDILAHPPSVTMRESEDIPEPIVTAGTSDEEAVEERLADLGYMS